MSEKSLHDFVDLVLTCPIRLDLTCKGFHGICKPSKQQILLYKPVPYESIRKIVAQKDPRIQACCQHTHATEIQDHPRHTVNSIRRYNHRYA